MKNNRPTKSFPPKLRKPLAIWSSVLMTILYFALFTMLFRHNGIALNAVYALLLGLFNGVTFWFGTKPKP